MTGPRVPVALLVLALAAGFLLQGAEADRRELAAERRTAGRLDPASGLAVLGGLRSPVLVALWMDCVGLERRQEWWALRARYQLIAELEPRISAVWGLLGWNQATNLASRAPPGPERTAWLLESVAFYERGLSLNPHSIQIRKDLGLVLSQYVCQDAGADRGYRGTHGGTDPAFAAAELFRDLARDRPAGGVFAGQVPVRLRVGALPASRRHEVDVAVRRWRAAADEYLALGKKESAEYCDLWATLVPRIPVVELTGPDDPRRGDDRRWLLARLVAHRDEPEVRDLLFPRGDAHAAAFSAFLDGRFEASAQGWRDAARTYRRFEGWETEAEYAETWARTLEALPAGTKRAPAARTVLAAIARYLPRREEAQLRSLAAAD